MAEELLWNAPKPPSGIVYPEYLASSPENWLPARVPENGDVLVFPDAELSEQMTYDLPEVDLGGIVFHRRTHVYTSQGSSISCPSWTFSRGYYSGVAVLDLTRMSSVITTNGTDSHASIYRLRFGPESEVTFAGTGTAEVQRLSGAVPAGSKIIKAGNGMLRLIDGYPQITPDIFLQEGRLFISPKEDTFSQRIVIGPAGTLIGPGSVHTIECQGKIAPGWLESSVGPISTTMWGILHVTGPLTTSGSSAVVELDLLSNGTNDKLFSHGTADFSGADLKLVFASGYQLAMGGTATLVEVPVGGQVVRPFRNAPEGWKVVGGGAVYELSYTGGASGKSVVMTRVPPPVPELAMVHQPDRSRVLLTLSSLPGMRVVLQSSTDLVTWRNDPSYTPYYNIPAAGTISTARPMDAAGRMFYRVYGVVP